MGEFFEVLGGLAEALGAGEAIKRIIPGASSYAEGRSTQTDGDATNSADGVAYERILTRPRVTNINDL